jgi:hypothetical protein
VLVPGTNAFGHTNPAQGFDKYTENFGDSFYSFWIAGVKYIVLNSTLAMCHQETLKQLYEEQESK